MTAKRKRKPRKPKPCKTWFATFSAVNRYGLMLSTPNDPKHSAVVCLLGDAMNFNANEARRLAKWLAEFADWAEAKASPK